MRITSYTVRDVVDLPEDVFWAFDEVHDHLQAAFANYSARLQRVYVTWSRDGNPTAIRSLAGPVITGWVDAAYEEGDHWGNVMRRARAMMEHLLSVSPFLIAHDAFHDEPWVSLGFRELEPPPTTQRPLRVFAYGDLPPLDELFRAHRLLWEHPEWRFRKPDPPDPEMLEAMRKAMEAVGRLRFKPPADKE